MSFSVALHIIYNVEPRAHGLANKLALVNSLPLQCFDYKWATTPAGIYVGTRALNSGPYACDPSPSLKILLSVQVPAVWLGLITSS